MNIYRHLYSAFLLVAGLLLLTGSDASAQLPGLWGSTFYRVRLNLTGSAVTGSFARLDDAKAPAGTITGQLQPGGKAFTADWTIATGPDTTTFKTLLTLNPRGDVLAGYRWTEEAMPTSFALHKAAGEQLVQVIDQDTPPGGTPTGGNTTTGPTGGAVTAPGAAKIEVITCQAVVDGIPQDPGDTFIAPKSIVALIRYSNLPPNSTVDWLWTMNGRTEAKLTKVLSGNGWHMHGLRSDTAIIPGAYLVTVSLNGQPVARRTVTVHPGSSATTTAPSPPPPPPTSTNPNIEVIMCESAPGGVPQNVGTDFTRPKTIYCLVRYRELPANTELKWVWLRPSGQITEHVKTVGGNGWGTHGFIAQTAMSPGTYKITIFAAGRPVQTVTATVR